VTGDWRKLHNEELHNLYSSPNIIRMIKSRRMRWAGHIVRMGEYMNACRVLVGKQEGKRLLGRPRRRWVDNVQMDLRERGWSCVYWIDLPQDRDSCEHVNESSGSLKCWGILEWMHTQLAASQDGLSSISK
jgi:hypothetical protein